MHASKREKNGGARQRIPFSSNDENECSKWVVKFMRERGGIYPATHYCHRALPGVPGMERYNGLGPGDEGDRLAVCGFDVMRAFESSKGVEKGFALGV